MSVFSAVDAVEPGERLHGVQPGERLVHEHRVQQRLVVAGLELLRDDEHLVVVRPRTASASGDSGKPFIDGSVNWSPVVEHRAGERDEGVHVRVALVGDVAVDRELVAHGVQAADVTTIAFALPPIFCAVCSRKCSTMISAFCARLCGCSVRNRAMARRAFAVSYSGSSRIAFSIRKYVS